MADESTAWIEVFKFAGQGGLILVGWYVVDRLSITRDRDKSRREMVAKTTDSLCESVDKLFSDARDYHTQERNVSKEIHIKNVFLDMSFRIASLNKLVEEEHYHKPCLDAVIRFRQAVTRDHFEDEHIVELNGSEQQIELIAESALALKRALVELKHIQFPFEKKKSRWCTNFL